METTTDTPSDPILQRKRRKRAVRESLERLAVRAWTPLQSLATTMRTRLPFLSGVSVATADDKVIVTVELPGVEAADIDVSMDGATLTVRATRNEEREKSSNGYYRMERHRRVLQRAVVLRSPVESDKAAATLKNGILEVRLPRAESGNGAAHSKQIPVRAA